MLPAKVAAEREDKANRRKAVEREFFFMTALQVALFKIASSCGISKSILDLQAHLSAQFRPGGSMHIGDVPLVKGNEPGCPFDQAL
jgi:hypothetical protein